MGLGDEILATGLARGAHARGKRIAFGDGKRIIWGPHCREIFRDNPNIAQPGEEHGTFAKEVLEWVPHYKGHRLYFERINRDGSFVWRNDFRASRGELFFDRSEIEQANCFETDFVLIEPNVKVTSPNKQWPKERYADVAARLVDHGFAVKQFATGPTILPHTEVIRATSFRQAVAIIGRASLYIGAEGGLHHAAAAVGVPAVVIFGGFISPTLTGYEFHRNMMGSDRFCGSLSPCLHCREAMDRISVEAVTRTALEELRP